MGFIIANISTIIVGTIVFSLVGAVIVKMIKDKKNNVGGCSGNCANCPSCNHK